MKNQFAQSLARALNTTTSLESVDVDINIGNDAVMDEDGAAVSPLTPGTDEPIIEAQETEISDDVEEVEETEEEIEDTENDVETLESIQQQLSKSLETGGLTTVSYEMFNITMDHIYRKYGITSAAVMPSMESFNEDQQGQTEISMEKVTDTLKTVAEGAKELIKKLWAKIKSLVMNLIKMNFSLTKRIDALYKRAKVLASDTTARPEIKLYSGGKLHVGGKVPDKATIMKYYFATASNDRKMADQVDNMFNSFTELAGYIQSGQNKDATDVIHKYTATAESLHNMTNHYKFQNMSIDLHKATFFGVDVGYVKATTTPAPERGPDSAAYKAVPLTPADVINVLDKMRDSVKAIQENDKRYNNKELQAKVTKIADASHTRGSGDLSKEQEETLKYNTAIAKGMIKFTLMYHGKVINYLSSINKAMLDYCVQSIAVYSKDATKEADKK